MTLVNVRHTAFYIELPFLIPHAPGIVMRWDDDAPPFEGWGAFPFGRYLEAENPDPGPIRPSTWMKLEDGSHASPGSMTLAIEAFGELQHAQNELARTLLLERRTVARLERFAETPAALNADWYTTQLDKAVAHLNLYLVGLAFASNLPHVRPLSRADLKPEIAVYEGDVDQIASTGARLEFKVLKNRWSLWAPEDEEVASVDREQMDFAQSISATFGPLMPAADYVIRARHEVYSEANRAAVVDAGTAMEMLMSGVLREACIRGWLPTTECDRLARERIFAKRAKNFFAPLCGFDSDTDISPDEFGRWWRDGYALRNRVAHEGHNPSSEATAFAVVAAEALLMATWRACTARLRASG